MNFREFEELINSGAKEITLTEDVLLEDCEEEKYLKGIHINDDNLIIDGNYHTIDANGKSGIFKINGENITLRNLTFKNSSYSAIHNEAKYVSILNCTFVSNRSNSDGGAIFNYGDFLTLKDCFFSKNHARFGGAIYLTHRFSGTTISTNIINCHFEDNSCWWGGGAIWNEVPFLNIENSYFKNNRTKEDIDPQFIFSNNIYNDSHGVLVLESCGFECDVDEIFINYGEMTIKGCKFEKHHKILNNTYRGKKSLNILWDEKQIMDEVIEGGIVTALDIDSDVPSFSQLDNLITLDRNKITLDHDYVLLHCEENIYQEGIEINEDNLIIDGNNCTIDANGKSRIFKINGKNITLKNIIFKNSYSQEGSAIFNNGDSLNLINCSFMNAVSRDKGGAIYTNDDNLNISDCSFENCFSTNQGVIYNNGNLDICNSRFVKNEAHGGSAIYNSFQSLLNISTCVFEKNHDIGSWAGVICNEGNLKISNSNLNDNTGTDCNVCAFRNRGDAIINNCEFKNNKTVWRCNDYAMLYKDIYNEIDGNIIIQNSNFEAGDIANGGMIHCNNCEFDDYHIINTSFITLSNSNFKDGERDGIINNELCSIRLCKFDKKFQISNYGVLLIDRNSLNEIKRNIVLLDEGYSDEDSCKIVVTEENTSSPGGFIDLASKDSKEINLKSDIIIPISKTDYDVGEDGQNEEYSIEINRDNLILNGNGHTIDGNYQNILKITGKNVVLKNINFKNGFSVRSGIILNLGDNLRIIDCSFENLYGLDCGAIHNKANSISIENCNFKANGRIIHNIKGVILNLSNSKFENNDYIFNEGVLSFNKSLFKDNKLKILNKGKINLNDCDLENNRITHGWYYFRYPGKYGELNIRNSILKSFYNFKIRLRIGDISIENAKFISDFKYEIIRHDGNMTLINCLIDDNKIIGKYNQYYADLEELISSGEKNILLEGDYMLYDDAKLDADGLCIDGKHHEISGNLIVTGKNVTLKNIIFNGTVKIDNNDTATLENCSFKCGDEEIIINNAKLALENCSFNEKHRLLNNGEVTLIEKNGKKVLTDEIIEPYEEVSEKEAIDGLGALFR